MDEQMHRHRTNHQDLTDALSLNPGQSVIVIADTLTNRTRIGETAVISIWLQSADCSRSCLLRAAEGGTA